VSCSQPRTSYLWCATFTSRVILLILTMLDWITCRITTYLLNSSSEFGEQSWLCSKHVLLTAVIPHFCGFLYICWSVSSLVITFWAFLFVLGITIRTPTGEILLWNHFWKCSNDFLCDKSFLR
jgi:hypothetical protein